jgi:hypothetical protein
VQGPWMGWRRYREPHHRPTSGMTDVSASALAYILGNLVLGRPGRPGRAIE